MKPVRSLRTSSKKIENLVDKKVKIIRSDNGIEFKNKVLDDFCREKGIKREYSVARTPQQNGVAERRKGPLIEAARTILNQQALLKLYLIHPGWKQCRKNLCNSNFNRFGYLWICLVERGPLEQNGSSEIRKIKVLVIGTKLGLVAQGQRQKEGIVYEVYVDDIIFGSTNKELCTGFEKLMKDNQDKYVAEILKKFNYSDVKSASTPVDLEKPLVKDRDADDVDVHLYRSMIGSLMYLTASRPDIMFAILERQANFSLGIPGILNFELVRLHDSDDARTTQDRKSTTRGCQFLGNMLISWQCKKQTVVATSTTEAEYVAAASCYLLTKGFDARSFSTWFKVKHIEYLMLNASPFKECLRDRVNTVKQKITTVRQKLLLLVPKLQLLSKFLSVEALFEGRSIISICSQVWMKGYVISKVGDEAVYKELGDRMERVATTVSSLEVEQDSGSGPRCQDTILGMWMLKLESDGFAEIIDFLKASSVHYALTVNPIIYTSCIEQFWATAKVQTVNGVRQLQALVDKKRVIVTESSIRRDLHLDDAEAFFSPQWKYFIHTITQCLSAKSTAWNEFSCSMASLIICLATNQKFNLSKYIFDAMVKHLDGGVKFLMYPRFLQVFINQQLGDMSTHKKIFVNPFHTKKVFANMKRACKDFSGRITPLFDTIMVQASKEFFGLEKAKDAQAKKIVALKKRIRRLERKKMSRPTGLKRLKKVGMSMRVESSKDQESLGAPKDASKQGRSIADLDKDDDVTLVDETQKRQDDELMFDTRVLDTDEMPVEAKVDNKDKQGTKLDDSTAGEAVSTIKAAKPKVVTTTATTTTTARPKARGVVVQEPSEFRAPQEAQPSISKDKGKGIMIEPEVPLKRKYQIALDE
ncbi:putative reverse transcriptase, RNA-dependent DNA polymerase [Tanacetum coccineum]